MHYTLKFKFLGPLAQLGEHLGDNQKVIGSSPIRATNFKQQKEFSLMFRQKKIVSIFIILVLISALSLTTACKKDVSGKKVVINSLTGELGKKSDVLDKRIVGLVVENHPEARPQWGIDDEKYSPDIILQGEVEGGISRTLWLYADYDKLPETVGPMRSARPPFIKFASLFDAVFVHWGMSSSGGNYTGADYYFNNDVVKHIDAMSYGEDNELFGRNRESSRSTEHTGILYGKALSDALSKNSIEKKMNKDFTTFLKFNRSVKPLSDNECKAVSVTFSSESIDTVDWTYSDDDKLYHTSHFENDVARTNILVLFDNTEYITKDNGVTYCDYSLQKGSGKLISNTSVIDIQWINENGKLRLFTQGKGGKEKDVKLNPGKTWIGWVSANNGGSSTIN